MGLLVAMTATNGKYGQEPGILFLMFKNSKFYGMNWYY